MVLDLILILLASIFVYKGIKKGFLITLSELVTWVVSTFVSIILSKFLAGAFYDNFISKEIQNNINNLLINTDSISLIDKFNLFIEKMPKYILNVCNISNLSKKDLLYIINNHADPGKLIAENLRPVLITVLASLISIILIFIFVLLITLITKNVTKHLPSSLSFINMLMGAFIGLLKFIFILLIALLFIKALMYVISQENKDYILTAINSTYLLKWLYGMNFFNFI